MSKTTNPSRAGLWTFQSWDYFMILQCHAMNESHFFQLLYWPNGNWSIQNSASYYPFGHRYTNIIEGFCAPDWKAHGIPPLEFKGVVAAAAIYKQRRCKRRRIIIRRRRCWLLFELNKRWEPHLHGPISFSFLSLCQFSISMLIADDDRALSWICFSYFQSPDTTCSPFAFSILTAISNKKRAQTREDFFQQQKTLSDRSLRRLRDKHRQKSMTFPRLLCTPICSYRECKYRDETDQPRKIVAANNFYCPIPRSLRRGSRWLSQRTLVGGFVEDSTIYGLGLCED